MPSSEQHAGYQQKAEALPKGDHFQSEYLWHRDVPEPLEQGDNQGDDNKDEQDDE
jgi:hypothetical protein